VLAGLTDPFDKQTLKRLYPGGRAAYLDQFAASLDATIAAGFLRPEDRTEILSLASASYDVHKLSCVKRPGKRCPKTHNNFVTPSQG
jgi:hypothetical protein